MSGGGSARGALELAAVGHRITHKSRLADPKQLTLMAVQLGTGQLAQREGQGPLTSAVVGVAVSKLRGWVLQDDGEQSPECPSPCGTIGEGSLNTFIGKQSAPVALVDAQEVPCERHNDKPIRKGAEDVWVNGLPVARRTDETCCGAYVGEGEPTVLIGAQTQTCRSLDLAPAHALMQQVLDTLFGTGAAGCAAQLGLALAEGETAVADAVVSEPASPAVDASVASKIAECLMAGDMAGALAALRAGLGY